MTSEKIAHVQLLTIEEARQAGLQDTPGYKRACIGAVQSLYWGTALAEKLYHAECQIVSGRGGDREYCELYDRYKDDIEARL